ncbi:MAG: radical SAM protein [Staphylothermus sp.]|nr:radical SAM protein [Staphylothermus sp.]
MEHDEYVVRASIGSLSLLGLIENKFELWGMNTIYLLQYSEKGCLASCSFCTQSIHNFKAKKFLSRITWPKIKLSRLLEALKNNHEKYRRICFQTVIKPYFHEEALFIIRRINEEVPDKSISLAITPIPNKYLEKFHSMGVDYLGIGLDAASPDIFVKVLKPYSWKIYMDYIDRALKIFGEKHVYVHLIVGLGENRLDLYKLMEQLISRGADIALFAYTSIGKNYFNVDIYYYREAQIIRYFLNRNHSLKELLDPINNHLKMHILEEIITNIERHYDIFLTSGCPECTRPYYNESPRGPYYNLYSKNHFEMYKDVLIKQLRGLLEIISEKR